MTHLPITARTKLSLTKERCLLCPDCEILEQTTSTTSLGTLSFHLQKTVGPSLVRILPCSICVTSVPFIDNFLNTVTSDYLCFPLTPYPRPAYVFIIGPRGHSYHESINKKINNTKNLFKVVRCCTLGTHL